MHFLFRKILRRKFAISVALKCKITLKFNLIKTEVFTKHFQTFLKIF